MSRGFEQPIQFDNEKMGKNDLPKSELGNNEQQDAISEIKNENADITIDKGSKEVDNSDSLRENFKKVFGYELIKDQISVEDTRVEFVLDKDNAERLFALKERIEGIQAKYGLGKIENISQAEKFLELSDTEIYKLLSLKTEQEIKNLCQEYNFDLKAEYLKDLVGLVEDKKALFGDFKVEINKIIKDYNLKQIEEPSELKIYFELSAEDVKNLNHPEFKTASENIDKILLKEKQSSILDLKERLKLSQEEINNFSSKNFVSSIENLQNLFQMKSIFNIGEIKAWNRILADKSHIASSDKLKKMIENITRVCSEEKLPSNALELENWAEHLSVIGYKSREKIASDGFVEKINQIEKIYNLKKPDSRSEALSIGLYSDYNFDLFLSDEFIKGIKLVEEKYGLGMSSLHGLQKWSNSMKENLSFEAITSNEFIRNVENLCVQIGCDKLKMIKFLADNSFGHLKEKSFLSESLKGKIIFSSDVKNAKLDMENLFGKWMGTPKTSISDNPSLWGRERESGIINITDFSTF